MARLRGDGAFARLQEAARLYPDEMVVSVSLLEHYREAGHSAEELTRLRRELTQRLADSASLDGFHAILDSICIKNSGNTPSITSPFCSNATPPRPACSWPS